MNLAGVIAANVLRILLKETEENFMQNIRWEQVTNFLHSLRCENVKRESAVQIPGQKEIQDELEILRKSSEELLVQMPEKDRELIMKWVDKLEEAGSLEAQQAYCQGYVDSILLLSGFGIIKPDISLESLLDKIK